jgi:putative alpha-1,2-mannosidase
VFSMMGLYPVTPGEPVYVLGSPVFRRVTIRLDNGRTFVVSAPAADRAHKYVRSASLDGRPWDRTWITHDAVAGGGTLAFEMADRPNKAWGVAPGAPPPSEGPPAAR